MTKSRNHITNHHIEILMDTNQAIDLDQVLNGEPEVLTQRVAVRHNEDGEEVAGFIILSKDSSEYQKASARQRQRALKRQAGKRKAFDLKTDDGAEQLDTVVQENNRELATAVCVDWWGFEAKGQPAPFNKDHVAQMLKVKPSWRDAIILALEDEAAFLPTSQTKSVSSSKQEQGRAAKGKTE